MVKIETGSVMEERWDFKNPAIRILLQIVILTAAYFILLNIFSENNWQIIDHIYTSIFMSTLVIAVTINSWFIIPRYLKQNRVPIFFLFAALNILACTYFNHLLFDRLIDFILPGYYFISYYEYTDLLKFFFICVTLTTLLQLSWEWFQLRETKHQLSVLNREKAEAELKALTNQVNPHFLFNSLTVLYSLSLKNSNEASGAIIKLSDILRYVIYESARDKVSLGSEINLIRNYLDLQKYRTDPKADISFITETENEKLRIEPMLLLPLVENSFKHGVQNEIMDTFINIRLKEKNGLIAFDISNNKSGDVSNADAPAGIGLKNIVARLKLVYPGRHSFLVDETEKLFTVHLELKATE